MSTTYIDQKKVQFLSELKTGQEVNAPKETDNITKRCQLIVM